MKKAFLIGLGAMMVMAMVFTGCDNPTQNTRITTTEFNGMYTLDPPDSVRAYAYGPTGFIRVSWDAVPNAAGYLVYRKAAVSNGPTTVTFMGKKSVEFSTLTPAPSFTTIPHDSDLFLDDLISYSNEFRTGTNYTYRVVAVSKWSSNPVDPAWDPEMQPNNDWVILQNSSKDSNSVSFPTGGSNALLGAGRQLAKPTGLSLRKSTVYDTGTYAPSEVVQVTWTAVPGVDYLLAYGIANDTGPAHMQLRTYTNGSIDTEQRTLGCTLPLIYGKIAVEVVAKQKAPLPVAPNPYYYLDSEPARVTETIAAAGPSAPANVSARTRPTGEIEVSWPVVSGAASYKVYRVTTDKVGTSHFTSGLGAGDIAYQAWEDITSLGIVYSFATSSGAPFGYAGLVDTKRARDDVNLYYMVVAVNSTGGISLPAISSAEAGPVSITLTADALGWDSTADNGTGDYLGIHIYWQPRIWATDYRLYRAEEKSNGSYPANWDPISSDDITLTGSGQNFYYGVTEKPEGRKNYVYKLVTGFGETIYSNIVNTAQYIVDLPVEVNITQFPPTPALSDPNRANAYEIGISIDPLGSYTKWQLGKLWKDSEVVKITRIKTDRQSHTLGNNYVPVAEIGKAQVAATIGNMFLDPNLGNQPGCWGYRSRVEDNGVVVSVVGDMMSEASSDTSIVSSGYIAGTNTPSPYVTYTGDNTSRAIGAQIIIRYAMGNDVAEATTKYNKGEYITVVMPFSRVGSTETYQTGFVNVGSGGVHLEAFYRDGGYQLGEEQDYAWQLAHRIGAPVFW